MSETLNQITIPDLDDEEFNSSSIPFGRSAGHFGFSQSSGQESPTISFTNSADRDRDYFHSRGDSIASEESSLSFSHGTSASHTTTTRPTTPSSYAHSSQTSITTASAAPTAFSKKSSFASLRNAFKSGSSKAGPEVPPPVPPLDRQAYPALRNPFSRSTSSLAHSSTSHSHSYTHAPPIRRPSASTGASSSPPPPYPQRPATRPSTPGSSSTGGEYRLARAQSTRSRSQHSHSGSFIHASDGSGGTPPPPPMPRMVITGRNDTPPLSDNEDRGIATSEPHTPAEFALHAVFMSFAQVAEAKIEEYLRQSIDRDSQLVEYLGPQIDPKFNELLSSLGRIAARNAKPVIDSIMRWRKTQQESVSEDLVQFQLSRRRPVAIQRRAEVAKILNERKNVAAIYIMCMALVAVVQSLPKVALGEALGRQLEETTFEQFREPNIKLLNQCSNHRANAELYATLLGKLSNLRFDSVTDRFLNELKPVKQGHNIPKELDPKYENLVKGLKHIQIRVWPPESFEEGADFLESLSKSFERAHGLRLKSAFAETLLHLLHPIGKTAQAEVNHPVWAKAIETIFPRARDMMHKPRYWQVAYPLVVTTLCVAPHEFFLRHWMTCFEAGLGKLKEKPFRIVVMNGMMRLIWTYLYRCHESQTNSTVKLDAVLKHFFPPSRLGIFPNDEHLEPFVYIVHFILSRYFEFGRELALNLMQEQPIRGASAHSSGVMHLLSPERTRIALEAILLSLHLVETEQSIPSWPSNCDFSLLPNSDDYVLSADFSPPSFLSKPGMQDFFDRCGSTVGVIATVCAKSVGRMSMFDEQWSLSRMNSTYDDPASIVVRHHPEGSVAYPAHLAGQIHLLHTCFASWPRCLHLSVSLNDALDMLIRGIIHVEPAVGEAASSAIHRIAIDRGHLPRVLTRFASTLFSPKSIVGEAAGTRLPFESTRILSVWFEIVEIWANLVAKPPGGFSMDDKDVLFKDSLLLEIEAAALFLLSSEVSAARRIAIRLIRLLQNIVHNFRHQPSSPLDDAVESAFRVLDVLADKHTPNAQSHELGDLVDASQQTWLAQWQHSSDPDLLLRLAESDTAKEVQLWRIVYPAVIRTRMSNGNTKVLLMSRDIWIAAALRYHTTIVSVSGIKNTAPTPQAGRSPAGVAREREKLIDDYRLTIDQWHIWVKLACCTASVSVESRPPTQREHSRAPSDVLQDREVAMTTTRGLFRYLIPFLDSEHTIFREAAVMCISSFPAEAYKELLEDLGSFSSRHCYVDTSRTHVSPISTARRSRRQDRLYLAVAHIYRLTAHHLKDQRGIARQDSLTNILKFVRHTQTFLSNPEVRGDWQQQRLRRYFCGIVECVFDGLASLQSSDRFIPAHMHLSLYRLCEEWCQCGSQSERVKQRLVAMQTEATAGYIDPQQKGVAIERFQTETRLLSHAAVGAMASLCAKAMFPPEISSGSPTDRISSDFLALLEYGPTLDRLIAMLASMNDSVRAGGRKALRSLVEHKGGDDAFVGEALRRSFVTAREPDTSNSRFFEVVADVIAKGECPRLTFGHIVCVCLANLCSPLSETRRQAISAIELAHKKWGGKSPLSQFEAGVSSSAPNVYLCTQQQVSQQLAPHHPDESVHVIVQCVTHFPQVQDALPYHAFAHILQSLSPWLSTVHLTVGDNSTLSRVGRIILYHLLSLTLRYSELYPQQVQSLWAGLVDQQHSNGHATVRFLLEQSAKVGSTAFVACARKIVACLSSTTFGRQIFEELCDVIEPARMLPTMDHKFHLPDAEETDLWSDLDALFAEQPRCALGAGQFALLFLADVAPAKAWENKKQLPILLHGIFAHIGHRNPFVREHARKMLFQTLRSWAPGYDDMMDRTMSLSHVTVKQAIAELERDSDFVFWTEDESNVQIVPKMNQLCSLVLHWLEPLYPGLADEWGTNALHWGTSCSIRAIAFRSLQIFRALLPRVTQADLAQLLGRLSNTIASGEANIQSFAVELILTLTSIARSGNADLSLLPTMYWCALACLSTPVESEFLQLIELLNCLLDRLDLDDPYTTEVLLAHKPSEWSDGSSGLQPLLLVGLRSLRTYNPTFKLLRRLAAMENTTLIDPSGNRVRDMYTLILPWCLRSMELNTVDENVAEYATRVGDLAEKEERPSIARIMTSFAKSRFRTKDDFMRQAAVALREHYAPHYWTDVVTLLLSLVLNQDVWLQVKSMQILKVLFQLRETRQPVDRLGSELLMPLLRLLLTDLAPQALEVLEEPMAISGGLAARHVLRMSMHLSSPPERDLDGVTEVFGVPEASGWSVARHERQREVCRENVMAVFDTCKMPTRPSQIDFEPEVERFADPLEADLGDLVQNLHELSTYFQSDPSDTPMMNSTRSPAPNPLPLPDHQLEARVAAILAKSTDSSFAMDSPQTPFVDVFNVGSSVSDMRDYDSDDDTDSSGFDIDTFAFDSLAQSQMQPNGDVQGKKFFGFHKRRI